eukprot:3224505-Pyramimonas_sp.AAC.1
MTQDLCYGKDHKWPTLGSGQSEYGTRIMFWDHEEHEVAYSWLRALKMWPGNGGLGRRRSR